MPDWLWVVCIAALAVALAGATCWMWEQDRQSLIAKKSLIVEIKAQPRLMLWITAEGVVHTSLSGDVAADYLERCAVAVREQAAGEGGRRCSERCATRDIIRAASRPA
jgi:hypothetical protein